MEGSVRRKRASLVAAAVAMATATGVLTSLPAAAQAPSQPLTEESLSGAYTYPTVPCTLGEQPSGVVEFSAEGTASGPYPGAFDESGSITVTDGAVTAFSSTFTITTAGDTTVEGTKQLLDDDESTPEDNASALCFPGATLESGRLVILDAIRLAYSATIRNTEGEAIDNGTSAVNLFPAGPRPGDSDRGSFMETYSSVSFVTTTTSTTTTTDPEPPGPAAIELTPDMAVNPVGSQHTVTATVTDEHGDGVAGQTVNFTVTGASNTSGTCTTDDQGTCEFPYTGPSYTGADEIKGCVSGDGSSICDTGTAAWTAPATEPGQVTGGGQIGGPAFGFNAKSDTTSAKGNCNIVDPATSLQIKCLDATSVVVSGAHASIFGNATVNGAAATYRIDVDDFGEPGRGRDTFRIQTSTGATLGGVLTQGNIQIHG